MMLFIQIITVILIVPTGAATAVWAFDRNTSFAAGLVWFGLFIAVLGVASQVFKREGK